MKDKLLQIEKYSGNKSCSLENCKSKAKIKVFYNGKEVYYCTEHFNQLKNDFDEESAKVDTTNKVENSIGETLYI